MSVRLGVWVVVLVASAAAWGQESAPVTPFPLDVQRVPTNVTAKEVDALKPELARALRQAQVMVPPTATIETALSALKRQDCDRDDSCLQQLAQKAETLYAMYAAVDFNIEKNVVVTGWVVNDEGALVRRPVVIKLPRGTKPYAQVVREALGKLVTELELNKLPVARPRIAPVAATAPVDAGTPAVAVAANPAPAADAGAPPPMPPLVEARSGVTGTQMASYALIGGGGAVTVAGVLISTLANTRLNGDGVIVRGNESATDAVAAYKSAKGQQTAGFVVVGIGAAAVVAGTVLLFLPTSKSTTVSFAPVAGGGVVSWGGAFP